MSNGSMTQRLACALARWRWAVPVLAMTTLGACDVPDREPSRITIAIPPQAQGLSIPLELCDRLSAELWMASLDDPGRDPVRVGLRQVNNSCTFEFDEEGQDGTIVRDPVLGIPIVTGLDLKKGTYDVLVRFFVGEGDSSAANCGTLLPDIDDGTPDVRELWVAAYLSTNVTFPGDIVLNEARNLFFRHDYSADTGALLAPQVESEGVEQPATWAWTTPHFAFLNDVVFDLDVDRSSNLSELLRSSDPCAENAVPRPEVSVSSPSLEEENPVEIEVHSRVEAPAGIDPVQALALEIIHPHQGVYDGFTMITVDLDQTTVPSLDDESAVASWLDDHMAPNASQRAAFGEAWSIELIAYENDGNGDLTWRFRFVPNEPYVSGSAGDVVIRVAVLSDFETRERLLGIAELPTFDLEVIDVAEPPTAMLVNASGGLSPLDVISFPEVPWYIPYMRAAVGSGQTYSAYEAYSQPVLRIIPRDEDIGGISESTTLVLDEENSPPGMEMVRVIDGTTGSETWELAWEPTNDHVVNPPVGGWVMTLLLTSEGGTQTLSIPVNINVLSNDPPRFGCLDTIDASLPNDFSTQVFTFQAEDPDRVSIPPECGIEVVEYSNEVGCDAENAVTNLACEVIGTAPDAAGMWSFRAQFERGAAFEGCDSTALRFRLWVRDTPPAGADPFISEITYTQTYGCDGEGIPYEPMCCGDRTGEPGLCETFSPASQNTAWANCTSPNAECAAQAATDDAPSCRQHVTFQAVEPGSLVSTSLVSGLGAEGFTVANALAIDGSQGVGIVSGTFGGAARVGRIDFSGGQGSFGGFYPASTMCSVLNAPSAGKGAFAVDADRGIIAAYGRSADGGGSCTGSAATKILAIFNTSAPDAPVTTLPLLDVCQEPDAIYGLQGARPLIDSNGDVWVVCGREGGTLARVDGETFAVTRESFAPDYSADTGSKELYGAGIVEKGDGTFFVIVPDNDGLGAIHVDPATFGTGTGTFIRLAGTDVVQNFRISQDRSLFARGEHLFTMYGASLENAKLGRVRVESGAPVLDVLDLGERGNGSGADFMDIIVKPASAVAAYEVLVNGTQGVPPHVDLDGWQLVNGRADIEYYYVTDVFESPNPNFYIGITYPAASTDFGEGVFLYPWDPTVERTGIPVVDVVSRSDLYKRSFVRAHGGDFMVITDDTVLRVLRLAH